MLTVGPQEMIGIFLVALLLFGPKKLPELGRMLGKGLREFKRMKNEVQTTFETHLQELEREARLADLPKPKTLTTSPDYSSVSYSYPYEENVPQAPAYNSTPADSAIVPIEPVHSEPVEGTVARSNGYVQPPITHAPNGARPVEEERPA